MSPLQAMERSYGALKAPLREGAYPPGHRLEAQRIADDVGVSMTPVRDALNRLVGERLVESSSGEGFHVPRLSEGDLRDLYEWHSALIILAAQTTRILPNAEQMQEALAGESLADVTSACFALMAEGAPNAELRAASAALHARVTALAKWTAAHDPERQSDARSVLEAAARFPLGETDAGTGFEPGGFQELILFIDDLPW